jgi:hypothetical protein
MGYTTDFNGQFDLNKPLDSDTHSLLDGLNRTRRMGRKGLDPKLYGVEGEFYVQGDDPLGNNMNDKSVIDYQPGLWCQWRPTPDGEHIEWDEGEKFYNYVEWIEYIINSILAPRGYVLSGDVSWQGEDSDDVGIISIRNNVVKTKVGRITYAAPRKRTPKRTPLQEIAWIDKRIRELQTKKKALRANG